MNVITLKIEQFRYYTWTRLQDTDSSVCEYVEHVFVTLPTTSLIRRNSRLKSSVGLTHAVQYTLARYWVREISKNGLSVVPLLRLGQYEHGPRVFDLRRYFGLGIPFVHARLGGFASLAPCIIEWTRANKQNVMETRTSLPSWDYCSFHITSLISVAMYLFSYLV